MFSLVLPTYNEAQNIGPCVAAVSRVLEGREFEIIVSDDDSPDRTWEVAENLRHPNVRVLRRTGVRGLSPAVVEGFEIARGELLGVMDADLQHDEAILPRMIDALAEHEFVFSTRYAGGGSTGKWSAARLFTSRTATWVTRAVLGVRLSDPMSGYFALRREVFERARPKLSPKGFKIALELYCLGRPLSSTEVPFTFRPRRAGQSKLSTRVVAESFKSLLELRRKMKAT